jgi:hypothetical protein
MIAKRYLCFAACLQIAAKDGFGLEIDQVEIADRLGVVLPEGFDASELVNCGLSNIRFASDVGSWGITPRIKEINNLLKLHGALECRFESISLFQDWEFEDRLIALNRSGHRPIVGFDYHSLWGGSAPRNQGHCALVQHIGTQERSFMVEMYDPGPDQAGFRTVDSESLYRSCRKKHGGIWSLNRISLIAVDSPSRH